MKVLIVMAGFFPGKEYGGPPVSVDNFCSLVTEAECYIVTRNHDNNDLNSYVGITSNIWFRRENCTVMYLPDDKYNISTFEKVIENICPDMIYLQGIFQHCVLPCLLIAKKNNIRVLLAPRGELCAGAFKKKYKKLLYIYFLRIAGLLKKVSFQSTSEEEYAAIGRLLNVDTQRIYSLSNIPSIPQKEYDRNEKKIGCGKFVFLSRIHPKKNLISAIAYFQHIKGNVIFDIYGPIEDKMYWDECQKVMRKLPNNVTVNYCGVISHNQVHDVFSKYDAFLFPTFSENYGHVIAEALLVGTPVIISDQTPWSDVTDASAGFAINLADEGKYVEGIQNIVDMPSGKYELLRMNAKKYVLEKIGLQTLKDEYLKCLHSILGENRE